MHRLALFALVACSSTDPIITLDRTKQLGSLSPEDQDQLCADVMAYEAKQRP